MKVALQITKRPKKGSIALEVRYEGASPDSFVVIRKPDGWSSYQSRPIEALELLCLKFGVNYDSWTQVWVRLRIKEQSNGRS